MRLSFPRPITAAAILLAALGVASPARAQTSDGDVQKLEGIFTQLLEQYKALTEANGAELVEEGNILVEPSDHYYAITLPHLTVQQKDGAYTDIGMIAVNALPGDAAGQWKMTMAVPTPIIHYDSKKNPVVSVNIGQQNFAGVWYEKFRNFIRMLLLLSMVSLNIMIMGVLKLLLLGNLRRHLL